MASQIRPTVRLLSTRWIQQSQPSATQVIRRSAFPNARGAWKIFSSLAVEDDPTPKSRRRTLQTKDPITLTEQAADRIKTILSSERGQDALGIRVGVKRRGCNGLSYTLNYVQPDDLPNKDLEMESHGVKVFIEPMALFNVVGTTMDWEETELSSEFTFNNPNSKGECGCGESFTV